MPQNLYKLPEGWEWRELGTLADMRGGATPSKSNSSFWNGTIKWASVRDLSVDDLYETELKITDSGYSSCATKVVPKGNLIIATRVGLGKVVRTQDDIAINQDLRGVVPSTKVKLNYLFYWFKSIADFIQASGTGATVKGVRINFIKTLHIPLPPLSEQKRIVKKLDALFSRIDATTSHLNQILTHSQALFTSESNRCFENLSEKCGCSKLSDVVKINSGIALPKIFKDWKGQGTIPFYKVAQMNNDNRIMTGAEITFDEDVADANRIKLFPAGSVLIPKRGGAILTNKKRMLLEDASYDSNVMGLKADETVASNEYVFRFLLSIDLGDFLDASTIPQINNKHIDQMLIPLPPLQEQHHIVEHLDALSKRIQSLEQTTRERLDHLAELKASLLDAAFRGEL